MPCSRVISVVAVALLVACASGTTHAPSTASRTTALADAEDAGADGDGDGGAESDAGDEAGSREENSIATGEPSGPCPSDMVLVEGEGVRVCVDRWEASVVEVDADGNEKPYPHWLPVDGHTVRAVSAPAVFPQGYISEVQAEDACGASHKRLCAENEWMTACAGPGKTTFPYGDARRPTACHDSGKSAVGAVFGMQALASAPPPPPPPKGKGGKPVHSTQKKAAITTKTKPSRMPVASRVSVAKKPATPAKKMGKRPAAAKASARPAGVEASVWTKLNDPRLGQVDGALAKTGTHEDCTNNYGVLDMMGNLHEWVRTPASLPHGTFAGGYYLDTTLNGDGCKYRTKAHAHDYHDYSTGFRCCADPH